MTTTTMTTATTAATNATQTNTSAALFAEPAPEHGTTRLPLCQACWKSYPTMYRCARCLQAWYCSEECQVRDWSSSVCPHKTRCLPVREQEKEELRSRLQQATTTLALQRRRRVGGTLQERRLFRPRSEWVVFDETPKTTASADKRTWHSSPQRQSLAAVRHETTMVARNYDRGHQNRGQGCRHQNAAVHSQPSSSTNGRRQAKWSSTSTAAKQRKNYKTAL